MSDSSSNLSALVSTTASLLAYTIPLLIISLPLIFAGTFLTLDRSRSFPSSYAPVPLPGTFNEPKKSKFHFPLQGGVGGLTSGYVFGLNLSSFLSVLIPAISSSPSLSAKAFMAVWILSCIPMTILGGRYASCARIFPAVCGGSSLALAISIIIHPSLLSRQVLTGLFTGMSTLLISVFSLPSLSHLLRPALRVFTASSGAFTLVVSVALLAHIPAWANVWERLWVSDGDDWGTSKEKGLSTFYVILLIAGTAADFALNKWLGECPDEKWDDFLANYSTQLPNDAHRAGTFQPLPIKSLWARLFGSSSNDKKDSDFFLPRSSTDSRRTDSKEPYVYHDETYDHGFAKPHLASKDLVYDDLPPMPILSKRVRSNNTKPDHAKRARGFRQVFSKRKKPVTFGHSGHSSSDLSDDDLDEANIRPWSQMTSTAGSSSPTLVEHPSATSLHNEGNHAKKKRLKAPIGSDTNPIYSDREEDITTSQGTRSTDSLTGWKPDFIKRHGSSSATGSSGQAATTSASSPFSTPLGAVPATPSLIKALDRITAAQQQAFGMSSSAPSPWNSERNRGITKAEGLPMVSETDADDYISTVRDPDAEIPRKTGLAPKWEDFWKEVKHKASS